MTVFSRLEMAPADPILGITEQFNADPNPDKVNLGVGVYLDEQGHLTLFRCVHEAEKRLASKGSPRNYLPIDGMKAYTSAVKDLIVGRDEALANSEAVMTVQSLSGTGALKIGADLLHQVSPDATVLVSTPSWANHKALFTRAGFTVNGYRYYDAEAHGVDFDGMTADLKAAAPGTIVVLHACCHNPTGYDLTPEQWAEVRAICKAQGLIPFLDMAYQGFSVGLAEDSAVVVDFFNELDTVLCASSFSKNFGLYGERTGALTLRLPDAETAARVRSQLKIVIRTNYSNPPTHGAAVVAEVLADSELARQWDEELGQMRDRLKEMRRLLVAGLEAQGVTDMGFITDQVGMFSYSGLTAEQMRALRSEHSVYGLDSGRLCLAGLNHDNLDAVVKAIVAVR